jgi:hypothetical protein
MRNKILFFLLIFTLTPAVSSLSSSPDGDSLIIKKCKDFKVKGDGLNNQWNSTSWINIVRQAGSTSSYKTKAKVLYSESGIYFLFNCEDHKLTSTMKADNLNLFEEDVVEVFLWPDENFPVYFEYELSPQNFELPIIIPNKKGEFLGWLPWNYDGDRRTQHATSIIGRNMDGGGAVSGWIAEFFIPFKLLNPLIQGAPISGNRWRVNMYRIDYDNGMALFAWRKILKSFHEYNKFGTFVFE